MSGNAQSILQPCPRCHAGGNELTSRLRDGQWQITCTRCSYGAQFWYQSAQLAVDYWNDPTRRAMVTQRPADAP